MKQSHRRLAGVALIAALSLVPGELLREPIAPAIAPYPVGVNDKIRETRSD